MYRYSATGNLHQSLSFVNGQEVVTWTTRGLLTAPGPNNNFAMSSVMHVTVVPSGETTVSFEALRPGACR